jgi:serine protease
MSSRTLLASLASLGLGLTASAQEAVIDARLDAITHAKTVAALEANPSLQRNPFAVLVRFRPGASNAARAGARAAAGATTIRRYRIVPGLELVRTTQSPEATIAALRASPAVAYAELDQVMRMSEDPPQRFPSDPTFYPASWGMHNDGQFFNNRQATAGADVNAPEAWYVTTGDPGFVVAIIDTGIQWTHHNLNDNIWTNPGEVLDGIDNDGNGYIDDVRGWDFYSQDNDPDDENGHGTHVAGTVGAEEGGPEELKGVVGMMWQCRLMPLRFLGPTGSGLMSDAALALQYATEKGVKVSNNSYGYVGGAIIQSLYDAINASKSVDHIVVAAAGNGGTDGIGDNNDGNKKVYPASFNLDNIISVAATDMSDARPSWSNYGPTSVDLGAPGVYILSTYLLDWGGPGYTQRFLDGTSMAAPHVAGTVGLVYCQNPGWSYQQVRAKVIDTARPVPSLAGKTVSGGVLDAAAALGVIVPEPPAPPAAPGTPSLTKLGGGQVRAAWADNSINEDGFRVQRETKSGANWVNTQIVATVGSDTTTATDTPGAGTFRYRLQAFNGVGDSVWSAWTQVKN